ncbi:hypothetical protein MUP77_17180, partial [Candidatus Bathyarchaeota archaeon]|nr:hypothetical protein [Candidatus Bathyarchaeota archaeon]
AGIIRIDHLPIAPISPPLTEETAKSFLAENAPSGSEGGLKFDAVKTQVVTPSGFDVSWGSLSFTGDLRDFDDAKKIEEWVKSSFEKLKAEYKVIMRQVAVSIDVEYGSCIVLTWNPRTDNWITIDVPLP